MTTIEAADADWSEAWLESDEAARWRSASVLGASSGARASGCSLLEIAEGGVLPRHTDSAEETIVVVTGCAEVRVGDDAPRQVHAGGVALVPMDVPHHVRSLGPGPLRFAAVYAAPQVTTTYDEPVQPDGERERPAAQ
jgi:quercetin dioxygenase-like cupin family protein